MEVTKNVANVIKLPKLEREIIPLKKCLKYRISGGNVIWGLFETRIDI